MRALLAMAIATLVLAGGTSSTGQASRDSSAARNYADALIHRANAERAFANVTEGQQVSQVRHQSSGLVCAFDTEGGDNAIILGAEDSATCISDNRGLRLVSTVTISRAQAPSADVSDLLAVESERFRTSHNGVQPWSGAAVELGPNSQAPASASHRFTYLNPQNVRRYVRLSVSVIGPWAIVLTVDGPADEDVPRMAAEVMGAMMIGAHAAEVRDHLGRQSVS